MKITIFEFVLAAVLATMLGLFVVGWSAVVYSAARPVLGPLGLKYLFSGVWLIASLLPSLIIRKPGIAVFSGIVYTSVHALFSHWGIILMTHGLMEGVGAEAVLMFFKYCRWNFKTISLAALSSGFFSFLVGYAFGGYSSLGFMFNLRQLVTFEVSAVVLGALPAWYVAKRLVKTGLFNSFKIVRDHDGFEDS